MLLSSQNQAEKPETHLATVKSPMRNRKLVELSHESTNTTSNGLSNRKISPRAVPSLMNGKYLMHENPSDLTSLQEIELKLRAHKGSNGSHRYPMPPITIPLSCGHQASPSTLNEHMVEADEAQYKDIWFNDFTPWHQTGEHSR